MSKYFYLPLLFAALPALCSGQEPDATPQPPTRQPLMLDLKPAQYADDESAERTAQELEQQYPEAERPEAVRMLIVILRGGQMNGGDGWFGPARTRYTWQWLAQRHALDPAAESLPREKFAGSEEHARRLDRDGDGQIAPPDLDWSHENPWVQQANLVGRMFRRMNAGSNGKLTRDELEAFFERASQLKDHLTIGDLRDALLSGTSGGFLPGDEPSREVLVRGLLAEELGSIQEGPRVDRPAPDFALQTTDGQTTWQLSQRVGKRPVVLVFGNFTCGPFRAYYPEVEALFERYRNEAEFVLVYVREAHPTDGWKMASNAKAQVEIAQPKTLDQRVAVCTQFCERLHPEITVVVDQIDDPAGRAYSGMPARMYVIDRKGLVAYQSGRGPFGFKVGEMEQALLMTLLDK